MDTIPQPPEHTDIPPTTRGRGGRPPSKAKASAEYTLSQAKIRKERALADLREMEVRQKRGELVEVSKVAEEWDSMIGAIRSGMLAVPSRVAPQLVTLTDQREIEDVVTAAIHEAMQAIADAESV